MLCRGRSGDGFADLLTLSDVDELVTSSGLRTPALRLVKGGAPVPPSSYTTTPQISGVPITGLADPRKVLAAIEDGATLVLQGMHRYRPALRAFCQGLEQRLGCPAQVNAYFTPPASRGLAVHEDAHDVFVLQCFGSKRWEIHAPDGVWDVVLQPGDALYMPQGTPHAATAQEALSGHLTIGLLTEPVRDVLAGAVREILRDEAFDERLPLGWQDEPAVLASLLKGHLDQLLVRLAAADLDAVAAARADRFLTGRPSSLLRSLVDWTRLGSLDPDTRVCRRRGSTAVVRIEADRLRLLLGDRELRMPAWVEPAVHVLTDGKEYRIGDLPGLDDDASRLVVVRRLVREGLLEVIG
jgi:lysine-specific demethylase/histidyl-hydroxylase NO66